MKFHSSPYQVFDLIDWTPKCQGSFDTTQSHANSGLVIVVIYAFVLSVVSM